MGGSLEGGGLACPVVWSRTASLTLPAELNFEYLRFAGSDSTDSMKLLFLVIFPQAVVKKDPLLL